MKKLFFIVLSVIPFFAACENHPSTTTATNPPARQISPPALGATETAPPPRITHTDVEWKAMLSAQQFAVLRQKSTEPAFSGTYDEFFKAGTYACAACGQPLFSSETKFDSKSGWPSFYAPLASDRLFLVNDTTQGMVRTEVECSNCGSHLGHVFDDARDQPTGLRYCMNSLSLAFTPAGGTQPATSPR